MNILNRFELADYFREQGFKVGAEVGVFDGYYSEALCKAIPDLKLYAIDPWTIYDGYRDHRFEKNMRLAHERAKKALAPYNCELIEKFSEDAARGFEDNSLDFVYIDGNHEYSYVKQDISLWAPKVREGGIIAGHDYYITKTGNRGVVDAVNEYTNEHGHALHVIPWYDTGLKEDDRQPNWYFVK